MKLLEGWIKDYNTVAPHSGLGMKSPVEYREMQERKGISGEVPRKESAGVQASQIQQSDFYGSNPKNSGKRVIDGVFFNQLR